MSTAVANVTYSINIKSFTLQLVGEPATTAPIVFVKYLTSRIL